MSFWGLFAVVAVDRLAGGGSGFLAFKLLTS